MPVKKLPSYEELWGAIHLSKEVIERHIKALEALGLDPNVGHPCDGQIPVKQLVKKLAEYEKKLRKFTKNY